MKAACEELIVRIMLRTEQNALTVVDPVEHVKMEKAFGIIMIAQVSHGGRGVCRTPTCNDGIQNGMRLG